ncbi:HutD family protein [Streptomyces sp. NPDC026665]|uniref:HutD/Ves family protein n=1 Tax=Streptomyces sp. NPDC026665 TaxID=3154798 RepID=UPI0033E43029
MLRADERPVTPWKNGGGLTREIASAPHDAGLTDFVWRVSLADVAQGGPFSRFAGVDRVITVVEGPGMELTVDDISHTMAERYVPFAFPGDATTDCRLLGGPLVDFNVMVRRGQAAARVEIARGRVEFSVPATATVLVVVLDGSAVLAASGLALGRLDGALIDYPRDETLRVTGVAAIVTLTTAPGS